MDTDVGSSGGGSGRERRPAARPGGRRWVAGAGLAVAALTAAACSNIAGTGTGRTATSTAPAPASPATASSLAQSPGTASSLQQQYEQVVSQVLPSVVQISTHQASGSGVVYDTRGDIVTNAHVVGSAHAVRVSLASGGKQLRAKVVGVFAPDDLAVIRVAGGAGVLHPASFGRSVFVRVGEIVLAMGNPLGLTGTVTDGIVSATGRTVSEGEGSSAVLISAIQTSAAINPGNSGGALVNLKGKVIGIPTLAVSDPQLGGAAAGIGFAIPSDTVTRIARQLIATGEVTNSGRASLGIIAETVADASGQPAGAGVVNVKPGGAAAKAGIRPGDVIIGVAGQKIPSVAVLQSVLASRKPGDQVQVRLARNGSETAVFVTLGSLTSG